MQLIELEPRWIHPNIFVFLCPHCRTMLLSCKNVQMSTREQMEIFSRELGEDWNQHVVPTKHDAAWTITGSIPPEPGAVIAQDLTITPSLDASASGHWHGYITNGEIK